MCAHKTVRLMPEHFGHRRNTIGGLWICNGNCTRPNSHLSEWKWMSSRAIPIGSAQIVSFLWSPFFFLDEFNVLLWGITQYKKERKNRARNSFAFCTHKQFGSLVPRPTSEEAENLYRPTFMLVWCVKMKKKKKKREREWGSFVCHLSIERMLRPGTNTTRLYLSRFLYFSPFSVANVAALLHVCWPMANRRRSINRIVFGRFFIFFFR